MRGADRRRCAGRRRSDADLPPLAPARAKKYPDARTEFAQLPAGVNVLKRRRDKYALQIAARRDRSPLQQRPVHVPDRVLARLLA